MTAPSASPVQRHGHDVSRLEGFSDAVFGFALTLLVVALEVPRNFAELQAAMSGFVAFAASFAVLLWIWSEHNAFFRNYGLSDGPTVVINGVLLFVVLFYVYPLKFMFTFLSRLFLGIPSAEGVQSMVSFDDSAGLMAIYSGGFVAVFSLFALLHWRAWTLRASLGLDAQQCYLTSVRLRAHLISVGVGVVSLVLAWVLPSHLVGLAGFLYGVLGPLHWWHGTRASRHLDDMGRAPR